MPHHFPRVDESPCLLIGQEIGIPAIISPEDLSNPQVDELSVMTFVAGAYTLKPAGPDAPPRSAAYTDVRGGGDLRFARDLPAMSPRRFR